MEKEENHVDVLLEISAEAAATVPTNIAPRPHQQSMNEQDADPS